jgi:glutamyl-tRNA synthetase
MPTQVVTRFAPSPTGYLHVGGARTALFSWLLARHAGGEFLLRIEDTDLARSTQQACDQLLEDLKWLGLNWDNPELVFQSKRTAVYNRIIEDMIAKGQAYKAYETPAELEAMRKQAEQHKRAFLYRRGPLSDDEQRKYESEGRSHVVRFKMPVQEYRFDDAVLGPGQGVAADQVQDFIIRKSDGMPTYHFAVVVDDHEMGVNHVLRGQEHLLNTVNHIALQEALDYPRPIYAHLPVILNPETGEKLSKRDRDRKIRQRTHEFLKSRKKTIEEVAQQANQPAERLRDWLATDKKQLDLGEQSPVMKVVGLRDVDLPEIMVHDFRKTGYLPEVLNNFLALLGWSPGNDLEHMSMHELVQLFTLENVGKGNAKFNREKLLSFNTDACAKASPQRLTAGFRDYLKANPDSPVNQATDDQLARLLAMKKGFRVLREVDELSRFLFVTDEQIVYDPDAIEKVLKKQDAQGLIALRDLRPVLGAVGEWNTPTLDEVVKKYIEGKGLGLGKVAQPLRVAVTGTTVSPPIFESLEMLGKQKTLNRIDRCIALAA